MSKSEDVEIICEVKAETALSYLIFDGKTEAWVPKSQVNDTCEEKGEITSIFIPEYLAVLKGLV